jgi:hypothetical protein
VIEAERVWATERHVALVDGIDRLDRCRDSVVTWVHLDAPNNKILAKALAEEMLPLPVGRNGTRRRDFDAN